MSLRSTSTDLIGVSWLLAQHSLRFELRGVRAGWRHDQFDYSDFYGVAPREVSGRNHKSCAAQRSIHNLIVLESIGIDCWHDAVLDNVAHCNFPALIVGATYARHNATTMRGARASELASQEREYLALAVPVLKQNATGERV
jgi:hypothetical protein